MGSHNFILILIGGGLALSFITVFIGVSAFLSPLPPSSPESDSISDTSPPVDFPSDSAIEFDDNEDVTNKPSPSSDFSPPPSPPSLGDIQESIEQITEEVSKIVPDLKLNDSSLSTPSPSVPQPQVEKIVFNSVWPDYYRDFLKEVEEAIISSGFISANNIRDLNSEEEIYAFLNDFLDFYKDIASLSENEYQSLKDKLSAVPSLKDKQKQEVIQSMGLSGFLNRFTSQVRAAYIGVPPFCYKNLVPGDPTPGFFSPVWCCNCGYQITTFGMIFHYDCGFQGALCQIDLGCLNGVCRSRGNGLWDQSSSMCGCG